MGPGGSFSGNRRECERVCAKENYCMTLGPGSPRMDHRCEGPEEPDFRPIARTDILELGSKYVHSAFLVLRTVRQERGRSRLRKG